ncbi:MAG: tRNA-wybutosine modification methyltransferase TYW3, partial [Candidatus Hodarchaeales archaeon]
LINRSPNHYTTSSCAGRAILISKSSHNAKHSVNFLLKTHQLPNFIEVQKALKQSFVNQLWLVLEPPVFHVGTRTIENAKIFLQIALESGLGLSMIKTISRLIIVETRGTGRIEMPIGFNGKIFINADYLEYICIIIREIMSEDKNRLKKWKQNLEKNYDSS